MNWTYSALMAGAVATAAIVFRLTQTPLELTWRERWAVGLGAFCGGMIGAKLPFVLADWQGFLDGTAWLDNGKTIVSGLVGGYLGVQVTEWALEIRSRDCDRFAVPLAAAIAVGRLACFQAGCCHGTVTSLPWGVDFGDGLARHPTQLYETVFHMLAAVTLYRLQRRQMFSGQLVKLYFVAYFFYRFATEFIRPEPALWLGLTGYQWAALVLAPFFAFWSCPGCRPTTTGRRWRITTPLSFLRLRGCSRTGEPGALAPGFRDPRADARGSPIDARGSPIDARSSPIDARGSPIDARGSPIDARGSPIDARGSPIDARVFARQKLKTTQTLCPECLELATGEAFVEAGKVYLQRDCPRHGRTLALVSSDRRHYYLRDEVSHAPLPGKCCCSAGTGHRTCVALLEITEACNLACPVCFAQASGGGHRHLDDVCSDLEAFLAARGPLDVLQISGGEPLVSPDLLRILDHCRTLPIDHVMINTNGLELLANRRLADVIRLLAQQSDGLLREEDFQPLPCSNPNCCSFTFVARPPGKPPFAVARAVRIQDHLDRLADRVNFKLADARGAFGDGWRPEHFFRIMIKPFMDAYTYDQDRVDECCVHVIRPGGKAVSFCRFNTLERGRAMGEPACGTQRRAEVQRVRT